MPTDQLHLIVSSIYLPWLSLSSQQRKMCPPLQALLSFSGITFLLTTVPQVVQKSSESPEYQSLLLTIYYLTMNLGAHISKD